MKIIISQLPKDDWWGTGINAYDDNWGMRDGVVPDQEIVRREHKQLVEILKTKSEVELIPFPYRDKYKNINHDFVFVRDQFVSGNDHSVVICNLRRPERKQETEYIKNYFDQTGVSYKVLSAGAIADGGEFYYLPKEKILFAGLSRNSQRGVDEMATHLGVSVVVMVETKAYHLDTCFSVLMDKDKKLCGVVTCLSMLKDPMGLKKWLDKRGIPLVELNEKDTIGPKESPGNQAVNSLQLPGTLISACEFTTPGAEDKLEKLGIEHIITPTSQFNLSGGSVHCLTNEL
jgi:N-dimethylarginine dimethylaminohydrolase